MFTVPRMLAHAEASTLEADTEGATNWRMPPEPTLIAARFLFGTDRPAPTTEPKPKVVVPSMVRVPVSVASAPKPTNVSAPAERRLTFAVPIPAAEACTVTLPAMSARKFEVKSAFSAKVTPPLKPILKPMSYVPLPPPVSPLNVTFEEEDPPAIFTSSKALELSVNVLPAMVTPPGVPPGALNVLLARSKTYVLLPEEERTESWSLPEKLSRSSLPTAETLTAGVSRRSKASRFKRVECGALRRVAMCMEASVKK